MLTVNLKIDKLKQHTSNKWISYNYLSSDMSFVECPQNIFLYCNLLFKRAKYADLSILWETILLNSQVQVGRQFFWHFFEFVAPVYFTNFTEPLRFHLSNVFHIWTCYYKPLIVILIQSVMQHLMNFLPDIIPLHFSIITIL